MAHAIYKAAVMLPSSLNIREDADRLEKREHELNHDMSYTARELRFAYECVRDPNYYKGPFTTTIAPDLLDITTEAVRYFTNTALEVLGTDHATGRLLVRCIGQR